MKSANSILGLIKRNVRCRDDVPILLLYKGIVKPHLEHCVQAWRPHLVKDINILEGDQRRFTKLVSGLSNKSYEYRLKFLGLTTLEERRKRGDSIEVYKVLRGLDNLDCLQLDNYKWHCTRVVYNWIIIKCIVQCCLQLDNNKMYCTRGQNYKLVKKRLISQNVGKWCFSNRVINDWIMLHNITVFIQV